MARAIFKTGSGFTAGKVALGMWGDSTGSVCQEVTDGDTINVNAPTNLGVRLLGVDAPEKKADLKDPGELPLFSDDKYQGLVVYLQGRMGPGVAANQIHHAEAAHRALEKEVQQDIEECQETVHSFRFFLAFSYEIMDRYGRFLCFINRYQEEGDPPDTYNERLLKTGVVNPYFIWPNIHPWRKAPSVADAVLEPFTANTIADGSTDKNKLKKAREWTRNARESEEGIFEAENPLQLLPFEVRFLGQRRPPDRWVIDLSRNDDILIRPENYYTLPNVEDRLFIPREYVPLFEDNGWQRQPES